MKSIKTSANARAREGLVNIYASFRRHCCSFCLRPTNLLPWLSLCSLRSQRLVIKALEDRPLHHSCNTCACERVSVTLVLKPYLVLFGSLTINKLVTVVSHNLLQLNLVLKRSFISKLVESLNL